MLAALLGLNNAFENPARQAFMLEMVGPETLRNAVSLNSVLVNVARVRRPRAGRHPDRHRRRGRLLPAQRRQLRRRDRLAADARPRRHRPAAEPSPGGPGQLREGLRYVAGIRELAVPLVMMALAGASAYEFQVTLPVMAAGRCTPAPAATAS